LQATQDATIATSNTATSAIAKTFLFIKLSFLDVKSLRTERQKLYRYGAYFLAYYADFCLLI
jgi:hypothetical protein